MWYDSLMGYTIENIQISLRLSSHNSEQDEKDRQAAENLRMEIRALVASDPDYERIASL